MTAPSSSASLRAVAIDPETTRLRVALFTGNYNMVRDGPTQALNRLVGHLLAQGAAVRVYAPTIANPAFPPTGDLVSLPSFAIPTRDEYRITTGLGRAIRADLAAFAPNIVHVASPDPAPHRAVTWARGQGLPVLASVHTRFETYMRYYGLGFTEPLLTAILRRFYRRCDALVAPSESFADVLRAQRMNADIGIWSRGVDRAIFHPGRRDMGWRAGLGIADGEVVVGFFSRLVMEKGLDVFSDAIDALVARGVPHRVLIVGDGPAREWLAQRLPAAIFTGTLAGGDLARAVASMDMLFFPSVTETFGNVTLEAMACRLPVVAAAATGSASLVDQGVTGRLITPGQGAAEAYADAVEAYIRDPALRARDGAAGEARALAYDWDAINQSVADTYLRLIRARQK